MTRMTVLAAAAMTAAAVSADGVHIYRTKLGEEFREIVATVPSAYSGEGARVIDLDAAKEKWRFLGLGTCFTEGPCHLLMSLPEGERLALIRRLFGPDGLNLSVGRVPCGSTDYSRGFSTYDDGPADPTLARFSIDRDRAEVLPVIRAAQAANPELYLFSSPWSPPAWMKDNGTLPGGTLDMKYADVYADYIVKFFRAYAAEGVRIRAFTAQNEPECSQHQNSPTCVLLPDQETALVKAIVRKSRAAGLDVKPWLCDYNFSYTGRVERCLRDRELREMLGGIAWHAYEGQPEMIRPLRARYPELEMHQTEYGPMYDVRNQDLPWWGDIVLRTINSGCSSFVNWCPVLDEDGEPNVSLGFPCWGLVTLDSRTHAVTESEQYRVFRHISPYVRRGAKVLDAPLAAGPALKPEQRKLDQLVTAAFRNPDGSAVVVIVGREPPELFRPYHKVQVQIRHNGLYLPVQVSLNAVTTVVLPAKWGADDCAPETWFHVIGGNASKEGVAADLDAIAAAGISGIQFFHGKDYGGLWPGVTKPIPCLSAEWEDLVRFTSEECRRRGLTFKMQNCPGWSMSGGPWVTPDKAMRRLVAFEPGKARAFLPEEDYREICTVTFPLPDASRDVELVREYPNPQQLNHAWAYAPKTNLNGRTCPPGAWHDVVPMTFAKSGASRLDMWEAKAGWGLRRFEMSTNAAPVKTVGEKTLVFGHVNARRQNGPAPEEATGWECDKMDPRGFEANFAGYLGKLLKAGVRIDGTLVDSWECGTQSWTWRMEEEFERRNGYSVRPWLPALFGYVLRSEAETERFLLDWRNTCSRLIEENYFGTIARLAHENGMTVQYETAFGDVIVGDILRYWKYADEPMCEFWSPHDDAKGSVGSHDFKPVLPCVSAAHVYGKRRVSAEALTSFELTFDENFRDWKKIVDRHFGRGVTHIVFHTYTHNPVLGGKPPSTSFGRDIGSPFLRLQTWWPYLKGFTRYLALCGHELERGKPAVDILMYLGDDVNHKPQECDLLFGNRYKYDYCNADVLQTRLAVEGGRLVLPDGMGYRVLWIPKGTFLLPATEARLSALAAQGARIVRGDFTPDWPSPLEALTGLDGREVHWYQRRDGNEDIVFIAWPDGESRLVYCRDGRRVKTVNPVGTELPALGASAAEVALVPVARPSDEPWQTHREYVYSFDLAADASGGLVLSLGDVRDWATVTVNGREAARLWCAPYACDIAPFAKAGRNEVRVEVVSTWYNTLVHEAGLPDAKRTTWTRNGPKADAPLHPSGLLGPVSLKAGGTCR